MNSINVVNPEEYFLEISSLKKHPNFKTINAIEMEKNIILDNVVKKGGKGNAYKNTNTGYRNDLGINLRSNWEANFARILNAYKIKFEFEPTVFSFPIKKRNKRLHSRFFY
jgi:hypothetical protein